MHPPISNLQSPISSSFSFRSYQREDLARSAVHDGAVIAWDPGLGKTMAIFAWPFIKGASRTLIVAPASLHDQIIREGREKFRVQVTSIADQDEALSLMRAGRLPFPGNALPDTSGSPPEAMPEFFITDYRWLGYNGADEWGSGEDADDFTITDVVRRRRMAVIARFLGMPSEAIERVGKAIAQTSKSCPAYQLLGVPADATRSQIKAAYREIARLTHPDLHPDDPTATARMQRLNAAVELMLHGDAAAIVKGLDDEVAEIATDINAAMAGIGTSRFYTPADGGPDISIKCIFTPSLSTLLADCFDCVVADEAVRLKSGTTYIASGVIRLRPRYRLALTGTPIKNRLPDIFFLASWVCGSSPEPTARWPYGNTTAHQNSFANNHLVMEENLTKQEKSRENGTFRRYVKQTNKITNVHRLWKLLGPVIARRRKDQIGNDIVGKIVKPIRVLPGTTQQQVYKWHIDNPPECATPVAAIGAQLQNLRMAALCPWSDNLGRPGMPHSKSPAKWSPKMLAILHLAADLMEKGEQLVVFSPFQAFSTALKATLADASVPALMLDGRVKNTKRGPLAADFKQGKYPVLIAGIDAMGEGHSFECASHLVIPSLSWAYDSNRQAIERVHRLTSRKDVTIYLMITTNSIDERLAAIFGEKGDSSDLALDGRLFDEEKREVSLADLIRSAALDFDPHATTLPEESLAAEWEGSLRMRLASAARTFSLARTGHHPAKPAPAMHQPQPPAKARPLPAPATTASATPIPGPDFFANPPARPTPKPAPAPAPAPQREPAIASNIIPFPTKPRPSMPKRTPEEIRQLMSTLD